MKAGRPILAVTVVALFAALVVYAPLVLAAVYLGLAITVAVLITRKAGVKKGLWSFLKDLLTGW